jgi:hypothetical protein
MKAPKQWHEVQRGEEDDVGYVCRLEWLMLKCFKRYVVKFAATPNEAAFSNVSFAASQKTQRESHSVYTLFLNWFM